MNRRWAESHVQIDRKYYKPNNCSLAQAAVAPVAVKTTSNQCAGGGGVLQVGQDLQRCVFFSVSHRFEKTHRDPSEGPQIKRYRVHGTVKKHTHTCFLFLVHVGKMR